MTTLRRSVVDAARAKVLLSLALLCIVHLLLVSSTSTRFWSTLLCLELLVLVSVPALVAMHGRDPDRRILPLLLGSFVLKLSSSFVQYTAAQYLYGGVSDANTYHERGTSLARAFGDGRWQDPVGQLPGTGFIEVLTGLLYTVTDVNRAAGYLTYSWLGFWGLYLCYRAFVLAVGDGDRFRYACLVLLLPSLLFWPSVIGKDAWMVLCLGATAYGAARLFAGVRGGLVWLAAGAAGCAAVRPHVALIVCVAVMVGYVVRPGRLARGGVVGKLLLLSGLLAVAAIILTQVQTFFGVSSADGESLGDVLDRTAATTNRGGSSFEGASVRDPLSLPAGIVTVLFRPFPTEVDNLQGLATSLEGLFLMALFVAARRRLRSLPRRLLNQPFLAFCIAYTLLFAIAFSSFNNFGILTRQRVQVFPFVLVLLACGAADQQTRRRALEDLPRGEAMGTRGR